MEARTESPAPPTTCHFINTKSTALHIIHHETNAPSPVTFLQQSSYIRSTSLILRSDSLFGHTSSLVQPALRSTTLKLSSAHTVHLDTHSTSHPFKSPLSRRYFRQKETKPQFPVITAQSQSSRGGGDCQRPLLASASPNSTYTFSTPVPGSLEYRVVATKMIGGLLFTFWRFLEIITLIPTLGMLVGPPFSIP